MPQSPDIGQNARPQKSAQIGAKHWISIFGTPNFISSDNGGEYIADDFYDMCGKFDIKVSGMALAHEVTVLVRSTTIIL